jgi:nucleoside 2-deoxyribosyltransferase
MKIYFVGSISGRQDLGEQYQAIVDTLSDQGHEVWENTLEPSKEYVYGLSKKEKKDFYKEVVNLIKKADVIVAEVSHPSLGVGHEVSLALDKNKPVILLYTDTMAAHFLEGIESDRMIASQYSLDELEEVLESGLRYAKNQQDTRFNFFISPRHTAYLDWIARTMRIPRSVYLRRLIEQHREQNEDYQAA